MDAATLFKALAEGSIKSDPFPFPWKRALQERTMDLFEGIRGGARLRPGDRAQQIHIRLLEALLWEGNAPTVEACAISGRGYG